MNVSAGSAGRVGESLTGPTGLPVRYDDGSALACLYRVDLDAARALIRSDALEPVEDRGQGIAQLIAFEYRQTSIGPYNEIALMVLARRRGSHPSVVRAMVAPDREPLAGMYVVSLPVTTEPARAAGVELWGFPEYLARIESSFDRGAAKVTLEGELLLEHRSGAGISLPAAPMVLLSELHGRLLRTVVRMRHWARAGGSASVHLMLTGEGPTAAAVRTLALDHLRPALTMRIDRLRFMLPAGEVVGLTGASLPQPSGVTVGLH